MFIGHYAAGFAAKKLAPKTSLGLLFGAAVLLDLVWPLFVLLGWEHFNVAPGITKMSPFDFTDYPLSHSLVMAVVWGVGMGLVYIIFKNDLRVGSILAGLVVSHWVLDFLVHRPDLPLLPAEVANYAPHKYGLGLWNHWFLGLPLECILFAAGLWVYLKCTKPKDKMGEFGLWAFVIFLLVTFAASLKGTPPSNPNIIAFAGQILQLAMVGWGFWFDGYRKPA